MDRIFYYISNEEKEGQICDLCAGLSIEPVKIAGDQLGITVGELIGVKERESEPKKPPVLYSQPDLMIFCVEEKDTFDLFLDTYREKGIAPTPYKAVATPHNISWTVFELTQEIMREHEAMSGQ